MQENFNKYIEETNSKVNKTYDSIKENTNDTVKEEQAPTSDNNIISYGKYTDKKNNRKFYIRKLEEVRNDSLDDAKMFIQKLQKGIEVTSEKASQRKQIIKKL